MWHDWFTFSRQDRRGILLLAMAILVVAIALWRRSTVQDDTVSPTPATDSVARQLLNPAAEEPIISIRMHRFDPNTADSLELLSVGLSPRVARNILRYRQAGGRFRRPGDLARIYGLPDTTFARVSPYIAIPAEKAPLPEGTAAPGEAEPIAPVPDTARHPHPYAEYMRAKHKPGEFVELNSADTTELMKIPGIGPVYARMIVDYRRQLGGFHSVVQLRELDALPEHLGDWVHVATPIIEPLRINRLSLTQLRSHPYLSFYQARAIVEYRKREGDLRSIQQLSFLEGFSTADIERLKPYLSFE